MRIPSLTMARLHNQQITGTGFTTPRQLVGHMGAMQAQDYAMAKWAIGMRLPGSTDKQVEKALNEGSILRTHVLRPTWHFVAAADIYWMLALSATRIKALMKTNDRKLELSEKIFARSNSIIEKCLGNGSHLLREALSAQLERAKISTAGNRLSHLLLRAELDGIICSGRMDNHKKTYALLATRVPKKKDLSREASLALLAKKYFTSRGPATAKDFSWWSGLSLKDVTAALHLAKKELVSEKIKKELYWFADAGRLHAPVKGVYLLPAFDECIIGYKDRRAVLADHHHKKVLGVNGIFNPVILVNGQVMGLWRRTFRQEQVVVEMECFRPLSQASHRQAIQKIKALGQFLGMDATAHYRDSGGNEQHRSPVG